MIVDQISYEHWERGLTGIVARNVEMNLEGFASDYEMVASIVHIGHDDDLAWIGRVESVKSGGQTTAMPGDFVACRGPGKPISVVRLNRTGRAE